MMDLLQKGSTLDQKFGKLPKTKGLVTDETSYHLLSYKIAFSTDLVGERDRQIDREIERDRDDRQIEREREREREIEIDGEILIDREREGREREIHNFVSLLFQTKCIGHKILFSSFPTKCAWKLNIFSHFSQLNVQETKSGFPSFPCLMCMKQNLVSPLFPA